MRSLARLYQARYGFPPAATEQLPKAGSNRHYVRLTAPDGHSVIGVIGPDVSENHSFIYLSRHFAAKGLPVPEILAVSDDETRYLQTDLGRLSLYQALRRGREAGGTYDEEERGLLRRTIRMLPHLQVEGAEGLDFTQCLPPVTFDRRAAMFDLNYFKYCFLRTTDLPHDELRLEDDFCRFADDLTSCGSNRDTFLYRDFQARNVMLADGKPCFIDYQGGRRGPLPYDVASFLWQASARYPHVLREEMIGEYLAELATLIRFDEQAFRSQLHRFVLFRLLQVLGAYGLRGYFERKPYFLNSIPPALQSLRRLLLEGAANDYPYLEEVLRRMADREEFADLPHQEPQTDGLGREGMVKKTDDMAEQACDRTGRTSASALPSVPGREAALRAEVLSFSYRRGIPTDTSGNGGGYVFDCRGIHNPGRYEPYKQLTGLDAPVIKFLEDDGEIGKFLQNVYRLADAHVECYLRRGFTHLQFCFGCTGGQHRSVYAAQHLAEHLHGKYGIQVRLRHREQGIEQVFPGRDSSKSCP